MGDAVVVVFRAGSALGVNQNRVFNLGCKIGQQLSNKRGEFVLMPTRQWLQLRPFPRGRPAYGYCNRRCGFS